jgi:quercetin dioxygenase-like cupin family protein
VTQHLWGNEEAGMVPDWCYVSSDKIHQLVLGLPPGGAFRHSSDYKTVFAADEVYYVLSGTLVLANPERGEVQVAQPGEAIFFRRDTWHHGFNDSSEALRVLEVLSPPPSTGSCGQYALTRPDLVERLYGQDQWLGRWPMDRATVEAEQTMHVVRAADVLWRLEGDGQQMRVGLLASTEHLTVGRVVLQPGCDSGRRIHGGDLSVYVLDGTLNVRLPENEEGRWFELGPRDGFYVPEGVPYHFYNVTDAPASFVFAVAPNYQPT